MENPSLQIGNNNWAVKDGSILGYNIIQDNYLPQPIDFTRASSATRVDENGLVNYAEIIGGEEVTCGDFSCAVPTDYWTEGTGWIISGGKATHTGATGNLSQDVGIGGKTIFLTFDILSIADGVCNVYDTSNATTYASFSTTGTKTLYFNSVSNSIGFRSNSTNVSIDNISVKEVTRNNVSRIDYTGGGFGKLLLEPQRTNLVTYSEDFSNAAWSKLNAGTGTAPSITANYAISPDGTQNATRIVLDKGSGPTSGDYSAITDVITLSGDGSFSIYLKSNTGTDYIVSQRLEDDRQQITITSEWQRFVFSASSLINGTSGLWLRGGYGSDDYADILVWAAQTENASYATSYIPTTSTAVTRVADAASKTGISSLINSTEGVLYAEIAALYYDGNNRAIAISDGTSSNRVLVFYTTTTNQITARYTYSDTTQVSISETLTDSTQFIKFAFKYKENDCAFWINGIKVGTDNTATAFAADTLDSLRFDSGAGSSDFYGKVQNLMVFPSALSDTELLALTTL